jgi:hypothetical protein
LASERDPQEAYRRAKLNEPFWTLVFRKVLTYTEVMGMSIGEFEECWQAYADYLEQQERARQA